MARSVTIPVRYSLSADAVRLYGAPTLTANVARDVMNGAPWTAGDFTQKRYRARARLALDTDTDLYPLYTSGAGATLTLPQRVPEGLLSVDAAEIHYDAPTSTSVLWRLVLGSGAAEYYWDGAAWSVASDDGAHWTNATTALTPALLSAIPVSLAREGMGLRVSLRSTDENATPTFYGLEMACSVHMTATLGARQGSQRAELVVAVLRHLKTLTLKGSEAFEASGETTISYANSLQGDSKRTVNTVTAVYDETADPGLESPLSGSWDAGTKVFTLDSATTPGNAIHVEYDYAPLVATGGDKDRFVDSLPALVLRAPRTESRRNSLGHYLISKSDGTPHVTRLPALEDVRVPLDIRAETDTQAAEVAEQVETLFNSGGVGYDRGTRLTLPSTGQPVSVVLGSDVSELARRGESWQTSFSLRVRGLPVWTTQGVDADGITEVPFSPVGPL